MNRHRYRGGAMTGRELTAIVVFALALIGGTSWYFIDQELERRDFRDDVVAMDFMLALGADENPQWDEDEKDSELEALVTIDNCWLVELEREEGEERTLPDAKGRKVELTVFGEIHSAPNWLGIRSETDVTDFNSPLTPAHVSAYLQARKDQYPCATS